MNSILFILISVAVIIVLAFILIFISTIPLYLWLLSRRNRFRKLAQDFNLNFISDMPGFFRLNFLFGKTEYKIVSLDGNVQNHQVKILNIWQNRYMAGLFGTSNSLIHVMEIDGKAVELSKYRYPSVSKIRDYLSSNIVHPSINSG